jgi:holliday junction DNA helicase RuvB
MSSYTRGWQTMIERVLSPNTQDDDFAFDSSLRPRRLDDYIGQEKVKQGLRIFITAARQRGEALDHVLLYGPPGLGKTTLATIIANEMNVSLKITSGPAIGHQGELASILSNLETGDVLFIDEVHRLGRQIEEFLYPAMEDYVMDIVTGKGLMAKSIRLSLPRFTVIGATTRIAMMTSPLRDRFGVTYRLDFYDRSSMEHIVERSARILNVKIAGEGIAEIARRGRGTPRVANRLLKRVRDYADVRAAGVVTADVAQAALSMLEIDELGLDEIDRRVLATIVEKFDGGPVGIETIAAAIGEESDTIMDVYEPYLLQLGFLARTPRGRTVTRLGYEHLGLGRLYRPDTGSPPQQQSLFS